MRTFALLVTVGLVVAVQGAPAQDAAPLAAMRAACTEDAQKFCAAVPAGGGRILACLKEHRDALSDRCRQAASPSASSGSTAQSVKSSSAIAGAAPTPAAATPTKATTATTSSATRYQRMKQVTIVDKGMSSNGVPAIDLLIPYDWTFKGAVNFGGGQGGCFEDLYAVVVEAKSADGASSFQAAPDYSWQYADDPAVLHNMTDANRRPLGAGGKPCPVAKPMKAADYFQQHIANLYPSGARVVSVEPFPELDQIVHQRLGLGADGAASRSSVHTDSIRARIEYQRDGQAVEEWVSLDVVTHVYQAGRGAFYDCRALYVYALRAPNGKLDGNDKLFNFMIGSVHPKAGWVGQANSNLAKLYQAEAQKEAAQSQIIAALQQKVADTINAVSANQQRGSYNAAFGADQNIRGVQTFRDPTTGGTLELSNQYDHAWLNGSNQYVMSDDPNFNPNGQLTGSWSQLQPVRPAP
ncbi:MAG TPA: cysteine rich repeat-containing protein [Steroidobacteraceae bacterium]